MFETIVAFLGAISVESVAEFLGTYIKTRVGQELIVWAIIYIVVRRDVKKSLKEAKEGVAYEVKSLKNLFEDQLNGVQNKISHLTNAIQKVEEKHFEAVSALTKRVESQEQTDKEFERQQSLGKTIVSKIVDRIQVLEQKLGLYSPQEKEI